MNTSSAADSVLQHLLVSVLALSVLRRHGTVNAGLWAVHLQAMSARRTALFIIARQHANARRARYCYGKSVRLSVCPSHSGIVSKQNHARIIKLFPPSSREMTLVSRSLLALQNSKENSISGDVIYRGGVGKY